jgi:glycerol-3-phosphate dehydrogenase
MKRMPSLLTQQVYDVAVIGGGIYGLSIARDAALRGLRVALVEQGDFGHATSSNHHKIIHGGLRYLQHADFKRMRESIRERRTLMRIAPHLVSPLPFLVPTYGHYLQSKLVLTAALKCNDLISFDRNQGVGPDKIIPPGRVLSRGECLRLCPGLDPHGLTGGIIFHDGQIYNPDRLHLALVWSITQAGGVVVNYARVTGFLQQGRTILGIRVRDECSGQDLQVRARYTVNCGGPWINQILRVLNLPERRTTGRWLKAAVLVTRPIVTNLAVGVPSKAHYADQDAVIRRGTRYLFITPWRQHSLVGTFQAPYAGTPGPETVTSQDLCDFIAEVNTAFPGGRLQRQDVTFIYQGLLPGAEEDGKTNEGRLLKHYRIYNHADEDGVQGITSVVGVKYTTARDVAEKVVDLVLKKLGRSPVRCQTAHSPVHGGDIKHFEEFAAQVGSEQSMAVSPTTFRHLLRTYGSEYGAILRYGEEDCSWYQPVLADSPVIKAEVLHGIREEMAQTLGDIILRRTELGTAGYPGDACLDTCARLMAVECGWDKQRVRQEIAAVQAVFARGSSSL